MSELENTLELKGRFVIVTGAAGAIGQAICKMYRDLGAKCLGADIVAGNGIISCDITDELSVAALFDQAEELGQVTDVVHAAGTICGLSPVADSSIDDFRKVLDVNLVGSFLVAREAARRLMPGGVITLISSQAGLKGGAFWGAYSASKGGVNRLVDCLAEELGPKNIRANSICPGGVQTRMLADASDQIAKLSKGEDTDLMTKYASSNPMKRLATPEDVAGACVYLSSNLALYVNGTSLVVDGGELSR